MPIISAHIKLNIINASFSDKFVILLFANDSKNYHMYQN